jgi:hypothetical protein
MHEQRGGRVELCSLAAIAELLDFLFSLFPSAAVTLLNFSDKLVAATVDAGHVVIGELAPLLLDFAFQLFPVAFDLFPVHGLSRSTLVLFWTSLGAIVSIVGERRSGRVAKRVPSRGAGHARHVFKSASFRGFANRRASLCCGLRHVRRDVRGSTPRGVGPTALAEPKPRAVETGGQAGQYGLKQRKRASARSLR